MNKKLILLILFIFPIIGRADHTVKVYGYAKLDIEYYDKNVGSLPSAPPAFVPLDTDKGADHSELIIDARESRIGVEATYDFCDIKTKAVVEGDFFTEQGSATTSNGRHFQLRHAYARADIPCHLFFLAGQFWSIFMNADVAQPLLIDFNGPVGALFAREPQFRIGYGWDLCNCMGSLLFQGGIEKHSANNDGFIHPDIIWNIDQGAGQRLPLFVGKATWTYRDFTIEGGVCGAQTVVPFNDKGYQEQKWGWGAQVSAQWKVLCPLTIYGSVRYLDGLNRLSNGDFIDIIIDDFGHLRMITSWGGYVGFSYKICENTSINGVYGIEQASPVSHSAFSGQARKQYQSFHLNIMHSFWEHWQTGLEFQRFETKTFSGTHGHVDMIHFGLWFFF